MNDEIKEILQKIENVANRETASRNALMKMKDTDYQLLLNYITNLQQKVEQYENPEDLTLFYMWIDEKAKDKMKELQKENERLKDELETMTFTAKVKQEAIDALIKRIDKAIEYIEKHSNSLSVLDTISNADLLKILQGDSDENN